MAKMLQPSIPVIDISSLTARSNSQCEMYSDTRQVIAELSAAIRSHGIFAIIGHGIPQEIIASALRSSKQALERGGAAERECWAELEAKSTLRGLGSRLPANFTCDENVGRGYNGDPDAPKESVSKFTVFPPSWNSDPAVLKGYSNNWPSTSAGEALRKPLERYYLEVQRVSEVVNAGLSECLGRPRSFVEDSLKPHTHGLLRAQSYQREDSPESTPALAAHKDLGTTTLLVSDAPGLQFQPRDSDAWEDVVVPSGALIVNLGEFFEVWTNGAWRATPHRVSEAGRLGKTSLAFFSDQAILWPSDGSAPRSRTIEPVSCLAAEGETEAQLFEWKGLHAGEADDKRKAVAWPEYFFERLDQIQKRSKGGA